MTEKNGIETKTLFTIIGMKEVELYLSREKVVTLSQALQQVEAKLNESAQNNNTN